MDLHAVFERLGFPKHSAELFVLLESKGPSSVSAIATSTRVHRPAVYRSLAALTKQHVVSEKKFGKRSFFVAENRHRITELFAHEVGKIKRLEKNSAERSRKNSMGAIRYFEGEGSVADVFNDLIQHSKRGDIFYRYTSEKDMSEVNRLLPRDYRLKRDAKRLERLVISNPESGKQKRNRLERFIKYLGSEKESFRQNAIQLIYGHRIAFIDLGTFRAFIIENRALADFQTTIFRALYKRL